MFSQLRNAVEQLAQQPLQILDTSSSQNHTENGPRSSVDAAHTRSNSGSSGQPADSSVASIRRSIVAQRRGSSDSVRQVGAASPPNPAPPVRKSNLEERLRRATAGIAEPTGAAANKTPPTTNAARVASPSPMSRGRTPESSSVTSAKTTASASSRAASPSPMARGRTTEPKPSTPLAKAAANRPPSRTASPSPMTRRTSELSGSTSASKPSSRPASPSPLHKSRTSELAGSATGTKTTRAASPSPMAKNRTPLRRDSVTSTATAPAVAPAVRTRDPLLGQAIESSKEKPPWKAAEPVEAEVAKEEVKEVAAKEEADDDDDGSDGSDEDSDVASSTVPADSKSDEDTKVADSSELKGEPTTTPAAELQSSEKQADTIVDPFRDATKAAPPPSPLPAPETAPPSSDPTGEADATSASIEEPEKQLAALSLPEPEVEPSAEPVEKTESTPSNPLPPSEPEHVPSQLTASSESLKSPIALSQQPASVSELDSISSQPITSPLEVVIHPEDAAVAPLHQAIPSQPAPGPPIVDRSAEVESLQARLKQVEQRFSDVSTSFKRLQAEKLAADAILRDNSPLEGISDADSLRDFFVNLRNKDQVFQDEIKRLNQKLEVQEDRLEELRDAHKLEAKSWTEEVHKLKSQLDETEALFQAAQRATTSVEEKSEKYKEEIAKLHKDVEVSKGHAKEEEEKRVKAISLLKTVRQKLVKAEKDREDIIKEANAIREREKGDRDKEQAEKLSFQHEMENVTAAHEKATANMKAQFEKDSANIRDRYEQEISALKGQLELDIAIAKNTHTKELSAKASQIATLENSLNNITRDKNAFFEQLQLRQAEVESSQAHLVSLQHQNEEFTHQLREFTDRIALLHEENAELRREADNRSREPSTSPDEIARIVSAAEAKHEVRLAEMKRNLSILEKERSESEADWSRKLKEKVKELEDLKRLLGSAARTRENEENAIADLKDELAKSKELARVLQREVAELPVLRAQMLELEKSNKEQEQEIGMRIHVLEKHVEEQKTREIQLKQANKTLRDELRKVQSSAALLERQRNPGVGYWTTRAESNGSSTPAAVDSRTSFSSETPRTSSPAPSTPTMSNNEEEVNLEYLRNVILQFLEHKEMRPNLVKVMSIILHFTPQETRRLIAKV